MVTLPQQKPLTVPLHVDIVYNILSLNNSLIDIIHQTIKHKHDVHRLLHKEYNVL